MKLSQLKPGEQGTIVAFTDLEMSVKLMEMGCLPGNVVELLQIAPFGDPLYLDVNGSHLAIRVETAKQIEVEIIKE